MSILIFGCVAAFFAGFVDSIAGGGGLIQVPALLFLFPNFPIVTLLGTNKLAAASGTFVSSAYYFKNLKINIKEFLPILITAFLFSMLGAKVLSLMNNEILKPLTVILLILIGIYTLLRKDFALVTQRKLSGFPFQLSLITLGAILGFYDGFFGPGMGSLLIFCFGLIGFSFLEGSGLAKMTNLAANSAALLFFILHRHVVYEIGIPMAIFNITGNYIGAKLAIKKGSRFVRWVFLAVVAGLLLQLVPHLRF